MDDLRKRTFLFAVPVAFIYLIFFLFLDKNIDLWVHEHCAQNSIHALGECVSYLGNSFFIKLAIALSFITIIVVDPEQKKEWTIKLLYVCLSCAIAIIIGEGLKFLLGRYRPIMLFKENLYGFSFFAKKWALNSSPSGHTIRAFAVMTACSFLFKRMTIVFIAIATLVGLSRVAVTAHYPSDVIFGAFIGIFTAAWTFKYFNLPSRFSNEKFENATENMDINSFEK